MPVLNPEHLLDQADRLITPPGGGAPRQADLRRAISNAYYAVFHAVIAQTADYIVGKTNRASTRYELVYRSINHKSLRKLCNVVKNPPLPANYSRYSPKGGFGSDLTALATAVIDLQEKRHLADYDGDYVLDIATTL
jgi:hypothetical protein